MQARLWEPIADLVAVQIAIQTQVAVIVAIIMDHIVIQTKAVIADFLAENRRD